jgi:hypothetical protein
VLERENRELRQANEILRKASACFALAKLDRRFDHQRGVAASANRLLLGIGTPGSVQVVGRRGNRQQP